MKAAGYGAWWNAYGPNGADVTARELERIGQVAFVITKTGYWTAFDAFQKAGVRLGVERYVYPDGAVAEGRQLIAGLDRGAEFAVINAEVEWEQTDGSAMRWLIETVRNRYPDVELYASVDTRGGRTLLPFQKELARHITAWMPMIYPKSFARPVSSAFTACLDLGQAFAGKPVLPTIQTYDGIGAEATAAQVAEVQRRRLPGCQAYTLAHATDAEWAAFVEAVGVAVPVPQPPPELEDDMELVAVTTPDYRVYATNWMRKAWITNSAKLAALQNAGCWPREVRAADPLQAYFLSGLPADKDLEAKFV